MHRAHWPAACPRCRTCVRAICEDCLPEGDIDAVGDTLPELCVCPALPACCPCTDSDFDLARFVRVPCVFDSLVRDFGATQTAYYIRCDECQERCATDAAFRKQWADEIQEAEAALERKKQASAAAS